MTSRPSVRVVSGESVTATAYSIQGLLQPTGSASPGVPGYTHVQRLPFRYTPNCRGSVSSPIKAVISAIRKIKHGPRMVRPVDGRVIVAFAVTEGQRRVT